MPLSHQNLRALSRLTHGGQWGQWGQWGRRTGFGILNLAVLGLLSGCSMARFPLFNPHGAVGEVQWRTTLLDVGVMMLIIGPVTVLGILFMWRYRKARNAAYDPDWSHSMLLELLMWGVPLLVVAFLGYASYRTTLLVNPYKPMVLQAANGAGPALKIEAITTDWQWVFIYPQYGIATIDDLPLPAGRPVQVSLTSVSVTNDFVIPQVAQMIDVMPGMRTKDVFQVNRPAAFEGYSADFSGEGFSWMQFSTRVMAPADFDAWVAKTQAAPDVLNYAAFQKIAQPVVNVGARPAYFSHVEPDLFQRVYDATRDGVVYAVPEDLGYPRLTTPGVKN